MLHSLSDIVLVMYRRHAPHSHKQKDGKGRTTSTKEEIMLIETRAQLAAMVHATYRDNLTKGSDAWRAHQAAKRALYCLG